jgi:transposase
MIEPTSEREAGGTVKRRLRRAGRTQLAWKLIDVNAAVGEGHKARAIVDLVSRLDVSRFEEPIRSLEHGPGRSALDPALLISLWIYGYSEGIGSGRELARRMEFEPALLWILGDREAVCHSKLSEFRTGHGEALRDLFTQLLVLLESGGWVDLARVMQDGTKIQAQAGQDSFRRAHTIEQKLEQARGIVTELEQQEEEGAKESARQHAARQRAARERAERLEEAWAEMQRLQAAAAGEGRDKVRVSVTEPEARRMKHGNDGGIAPSYNLQLSTDAQARIIVGAGLTQEAGDAHQLLPAVERIEEEWQRRPAQVIADGGYTTRANIVGMAALEVDFVGSLGDVQARQAAALKSNGIGASYGPAAFVQIGEGRGSLQCPAGRVLGYVRRSRKRGLEYFQYQADGKDCRSCPHQGECCPKRAERGRTVSILQELPEVVAFQEKMETEEARQAYRQRGNVAEFPNAWLKEKIGLRKFRLRGMVKAGLEALWACFTYNAMQWGRLQGQLRLAAV